MEPTQYWDPRDRNVPLMVMLARRTASQCICCGMAGHMYNECTQRPAHRPAIARKYDPAVKPIVR
jgi:hypothetical protein